MKRLLVLLAVLFALSLPAVAQTFEPKLEGYIATDGHFLTVAEMAALFDSPSLIGKYLQRYASAPTCSRAGQMYYDSGLSKQRVCTVAGAPGTWETVVSGSGSPGTVTSVSVVTANGLSGTVANPTTTPAITLNVSALDAAKIGGGGVSTAEFDFLGTLTSNVQTQLDAKQAGPLTGDVTTSGAASTLATVNSNVGSFGSATQSLTLTVNGKGLVTAAAAQTVTPAVGSISGLGTGVATALGVNVGSAGALVVNGGVLGTPSSGVGTNITGVNAATLGGATFAAPGAIGGTTPAAGSFTTVGVGDGTAAVPTHSFINDPNTGFYSSGADQVGLTVGGSLWGGFFASGSRKILNFEGQGDLESQGNSAIGFSGSNVIIGHNHNFIVAGALLTIGDGHTRWKTDNTYDLGADAASRPATINAGTAIKSPVVNATTSLQVGGTVAYSVGTPSIAGNATLNTGSKDSAGKITSTGTGASTAVITFSITFTRAPSCFVTNETTANLVRPVSTTTTLTVNATVVTGDSLSYICLGY